LGWWKEKIEDIVQYLWWHKVVKILNGPKVAKKVALVKLNYMTRKSSNDFNTLMVNCSGDSSVERIMEN